MAPTYFMPAVVDLLDVPRAALGRDLGRSLVARALDDATTSTSTSPTSSSNLSHTTSPTAESDMMTIAVEKIKPWLVPMALIIVGFIILVFLCCCVRWKRVAEIREERASGKQSKDNSGRSLKKNIEGDKRRLSEKTSSLLDSSRGSRDGSKDSSKVGASTELRAKRDVENAAKTETRAERNVENAAKTEPRAERDVENAAKTESHAERDVESAKSKPFLVIDTSMTRKEEQTDNVSETFEEYVAREVGRITTPSTTTTSAFTEIVETGGDHYLGGDLRAPTPASLYSTRSSSPTSSVRSVSSEQCEQAISSATPVTPTTPIAVEEGSETALARIYNTVNVETGQSAKVVSEEPEEAEEPDEAEEPEEAVVTSQASEEPVGIAITTEEDVAIAAAARASLTSTTTASPPEDTPVKSQRLVIYPRVDAAGRTSLLGDSEVDKEVYNSRTLVLSALPNVL